MNAISRRIRSMWRTEYVVLCVSWALIGLLFGAIVHRSQQNETAAREAASRPTPPVLHYTLWKSTRPSYRPGDGIVFRYRRKSDVEGVYGFSTEIWERIPENPGEESEYIRTPGLTGIYYDHAGTQWIRSRRQVPEYARAGRYRVVGWFVGGPIGGRPAPVPFSSAIFQILPPAPTPPLWP